MNNKSWSSCCNCPRIASSKENKNFNRKRAFNYILSTLAARNSYPYSQSNLAHSNLKLSQNHRETVQTSCLTVLPIKHLGIKY